LCPDSSPPVAKRHGSVLHRAWLVVLFAMASAACAVASAQEIPLAVITIHDITPKFLVFYKAAESQHAAPDLRWALWKSLYDFAAVPPTADGDIIARRQLDAAWLSYAAALPEIELGAAGLQPSPQVILGRVMSLLKPDQPVHLRVLVYVGSFDGNAFTTASSPRRPTVALPVEQSEAARGPIMAHEFTHAVQISMGMMSGGWLRTVGETVLAEGLAMRTAERLYPVLPPTRFVEIVPGWFDRAEHLRRAILLDVRLSLRSDASGDVMRFTMGHGQLGIDREAYYAGWLVVGAWLGQGRSLADIARVPERDAPAAVESAIDALLAAPMPLGANQTPGR